MPIIHDDDTLLVDWRQAAACADLPSELFFPVGESGESADQIEAAKATCGVCPVQTDCLEYALDTNQIAGIWGGYTAEERRPLRRRRLAEHRRRPG